MSADCGKLKNSNCFRHAHKGDFPKFGHIMVLIIECCRISRVCILHLFPPHTGLNISLISCIIDFIDGGIILGKSL